MAIGTGGRFDHSGRQRMAVDRFTVRLGDLFVAPSTSGSDVRLEHRTIGIIGGQETVAAVTINTCGSCGVSSNQQSLTMNGIFKRLDHSRLGEIGDIIRQLLIFVTGDADLRGIGVAGTGSWVERFLYIMAAMTGDTGRDPFDIRLTSFYVRRLAVPFGFGLVALAAEDGAITLMSRGRIDCVAISAYQRGMN